MGMTTAESITSNSLLQYILTLALLTVFLLGAVLLHLSLRIIIKRLQGRHPQGMAHQILRGIKHPAVLLIATLGFFLALVTLPSLAQWQNGITRGWTILVVLLIGRSLANITNVMLNWYIQTVGTRNEPRGSKIMLPIIRRISMVVIYGVIALITLDTLGVSISPLLGGLGITGLAVALALQPTLGNFFAGTYVLSDGAIHTGDYIELHGGPAGYVLEIGWRSTKIRTWLNNLVIVPNSVLADTIVTNFQGPNAEMNVIVTCGVSYASDLEKVKQVSMEVAREVLEECPEAIKSMEPWFGFDHFGDSNIDFWVFLQATDRIGSYIVTNALIMKLHARFATEGIEINYPVRKLVYSESQAPKP